MTLGFLPGGDRSFDEALPLRGQPKGLSAGVFSRHDLQPAMRPHPFDIAAKGGRIQLEKVADLGGSGKAELGRNDQDIQLANFKTQRAQGVVVEVRHNPVQQA